MDKLAYEVRTYRNWVEDKDLVSFTVKEGESDLFIQAKRLLDKQARRTLSAQRRLIKDYIQRHPQFAAAVEPLSVDKDAQAIIRNMAEAAFAAQVGPMAAVAGAVAEYVGKDLLLYSSEVIVENGGDIFIKSDKPRKIGIFAGTSSYTGKLALEVKPQERYLGVCTSSGTVGPSLSFGHSDATVVICDSAILADAWATRLGNMVKTAADIEPTLRFVQNIPTIKAVVIIVGEKVGVQGNVKLVKS